MGYIEPSSDIVLLHNIKLDSTYENTIYFTSKAEQEAYFFNSSKILMHLTRHTYNRTKRNSIKLKVDIATVEHCTYLAFKNTSYENKWFYCFVDDFNYINDNTTEVFYHIDFIQTYFIGECTLQQCFVEREHDPSDIVGSNRVPEPIGSDHLLYTLKWECAEMNEYSVIISASVKDISIASDDYYKQGMFNGLEVKDYSLTDASDAAVIMNKLQDMLGDGNYVDPEEGATRQQVVSAIMFPSTFVQETSTKPKKVISGFSKTRTNVSGYTPKNKKLLTAPYKSLLLSNGIGGAVSLDYDDFTVGDYVNFKLWGVCSGSGEMICIPQNYKGVEDNYDFKLMINGFPQCAYTLDSYRAWIAGGGDKYAKMGLIQSIANGLNTAFNLGIGQLAGMNNVINAYEDAGNTIYAGASINKTVQAYTKAERIAENQQMKNIQAAAGSNLASGIAGGAITYMETKYEQGNRVNVPVGENSASCLVADRSLNFRCYELNIVAEDAERIDNFFSMYGYATNKLKVPNISARPQWNYVKTKGCIISGDIPSSIRTSIQLIFDSGLRFWKNGDNIGNYSLNNAPVIGG